jgi:hypothetical protein
MYLAEPVCDDVNATLPLEVYTVSFDSQYYTTTQGNIHISLASPFRRFIYLTRDQEAPTSGS